MWYFGLSLYFKRMIVYFTLQDSVISTYVLILAVEPAMTPVACSIIQVVLLSLTI